MNKLEEYIVGLLQGKLEYNDKSVQVRRQFNNIDDDLPVVTLDITSVDTEQVHRVPSLSNFVEVGDNIDSVVYERTAEMSINLWCNTEEEREAISSQIEYCFKREQSGHYTYCTQYNDGNCETTQSICSATLEETARAMKNLCPYPCENKYQSLSSHCNIIQGSLDLESPVMLDEYDKHPPLLRNMFRVHASYYDVYNAGGELLREVRFNNS